MSNTFQLIDRRPIESLNVELRHYRHPVTGADHYHLASDHQENVFMVALRTVPRDNTGVAHILEHTVLCGSERYPVRDPFFLMMRRSLNTFMNAFTSSDWTAYPFASENEKDFRNLLDVYLDSVFFSNLAELDFAQEGHRLAFKSDENSESESLEFRGVVYNEMKGAMSSASARLYQTLTKYVFPTSTYHFNSGGEPQSIPALTYDGLKAFYDTHYHPSNAVFLTFGNLDESEVQNEIEAKVMQRFTSPVSRASVPREERYNAPVQVTEYYPVADADDNTPKNHQVMGWLLGDSIDLRGQLEAHFLSDVLMGNSSSPLRAALETTDLGSAVSPLMGVEDSNREMMFVCGLEGTDGQAEPVEQLILDTLQQVVEQGIPLDDQLAVLHQLELDQREIGGDGMPFGLQLIMTALPTATHGGDVASMLDIDDALLAIRADLQDPSFLPGLIGRLLLDNPHRVSLTLKADPEFSKRADAEEKSRLERINQSLTPEQKADIRALNDKLEAHQQTEPDMDSLPKVTLDDVPKALKTRTPRVESDSTTAFGEGTNGLNYLSWVRALPALSEEEMRWLPLYTTVLTEVGQGEQPYTEIQRQQTRVSGGLSAGVSHRADKASPDRLHSYLTVNGTSLQRNTPAMNELLHGTVKDARVDESDRLHELLQTILTRRLQGVTGGGHALAMTAASAYWSAGAALQHHQSGLSGLSWLKALVKSDKSSYINEVQDTLKALHNNLSAQSGHLMAIGEPEWVDSDLSAIQSLWQSDAGILDTAAQERSLPEADRYSAWQTDTPVNFCAQAFKAVPSSHPDAAALAVLSGVLSNGFLHTAIREQGGAYGGGASHDMSNGVFRFFSYRDPRLADTFADFERSLEWLAGKDLGYQPIEESVLSLISGMDKPGSPAGEARQAFFNTLFDRDLAFRETIRERILSVTDADLKRVADAYLKPEHASRSVVTGADRITLCESLGMTAHTL